MRIQHHGHDANNTAELSPARQRIAGKHHSTFMQSTTKIPTKLLPQATLIELSDIRIDYSVEV